MALVSTVCQPQLAKSLVSNLKREKKMIVSQSEFATLLRVTVTTTVTLQPQLSMIMKYVGIGRCVKIKNKQKHCQ